MVLLLLLVMGFKKNLKKLLTLPTEMRLDEVTSVLLRYGWYLERVKGSHFHFVDPHGQIFTLPVHNGVIAKRYLKKIVSDIILYEHET